MAFFELEKEVHSLISRGAKFQMCMASLVNVFSFLFVTFNSFKSPENFALVLMPSAWLSTLTVLIG